MSTDHTTDEIRQLVRKTRGGSLPRRDFLRRVVTLGVSSAAAYALLNQSKAEATSPTAFAGENSGPPPTFTTRALGEEGPPPSARHGEGSPCTGRYGEEGPNFTTRALGEEGNPPTAACGEDGHPPASTMRYGEEGQPKITSRSIGEEGQPNVTTQAVGEEGPPQRPAATTRALGEESTRPPTATTFAVGEEGQPVNSGNRQSPRSTARTGNPTSQVWKNFLRW